MLGKWVFEDDGEGFSTGEIVECIDDHFYLIKIDPHEEVPAAPMRLVCLHDLSEVLDDGAPRFLFFNTREELTLWMNWLTSDKKPKIVEMKHRESST